MSEVLRFEGATVGYDRPVVSGVDLSVAAGEVVGLIGPNGSGKTTLLRAVTGAAAILGGEVRLLGRGVRSYNARERARVVAVVPQSMSAESSFPASTFVAMGRHPHVSRFGDLTAHDRDAVRRAMEATDTARLADEPVDTLSGGDVQRLTLAQALAQEPALLLLDEPTSHLDLNHRLQVLDLVGQVAQEGLAVLVVFHDLDMAARYADRIAPVADGAVGEAEAPAAVLTAETVARVFAVRSVIGTDPVTGAVSVTPVVREQPVAAPRDERVLVVSGSGSGAAVMRRLVLAGFRVCAAALAAGDTDLAVADALGVSAVRLPPYGSMGEVEQRAVAEAARDSDVIVVCATPTARANLGNLTAVAGASGAQVVLVGEMDGEMDFTGGEASRTWASLAEAGALRCGAVAEVVRCVEEAMSR